MNQIIFIGLVPAFRSSLFSSWLTVCTARISINKAKLCYPLIWGLVLLLFLSLAARVERKSSEKAGKSKAWRGSSSLSTHQRGAGVTFNKVLWCTSKVEDVGVFAEGEPPPQ
jgi:hypothetical protein